MNNKLVTYEESVKLLKKLERDQKFNKHCMRKSGSIEMRKLYQSRFESLKDNINVILSLIAAHKEARRMFGKLKDLDV